MRHLMFLFFALALAGAVPAAEWYVEIVEEGVIGANSSLVLDSYGFPHVSYTDNVNADIKYAYWDGSKWRIETVQSNGYLNRSSLALDSYGWPHISYYDGLPNYDLKYARCDVWGWHIETVDWSGDVGYYSSLKLDSSNFPHIAYFFKSVANLKYAAWDGNEWKITVVDYEGNIGYEPTLVMDEDDRPHIAYVDGSDAALNYAYWDGNRWLIEAVVTGVGVLSPSLALDSNGNPHIAYFAGYPNIALEYVFWDGDEWRLQIVESRYADSISLALDSSDLPHISYRLEPNHYLKYAHWDGEEWQILTLESEPYYGHVGEGTSLAIDFYDFPHITYSGDRNLKHAWYGYGPGVEGAEVFANVGSEGVLVGWRITGDIPARLLVLRSAGDDEPANVSGSLDGAATRWLDRNVIPGNRYTYWLEVVEDDGTVSRFGPTEAVTFPGAAREIALSVYPSPASGSFTVDYTLPEGGRVVVSLYDLSGRRVATVYDGETAAGRHDISCNASALPAGVYLVRLATDAGALTRRVVVAR